MEAQVDQEHGEHGVLLAPDGLGLDLLRQRDGAGGVLLGAPPVATPDSLDGAVPFGRRAGYRRRVLLDGGGPSGPPRASRPVPPAASVTAFLPHGARAEPVLRLVADDTPGRKSKPQPRALTYTPRIPRIVGRRSCAPAQPGGVEALGATTQILLMQCTTPCRRAKEPKFPEHVHRETELFPLGPHHAVQMLQVSIRMMAIRWEIDVTAHRRTVLDQQLFQVT